MTENEIIAHLLKRLGNVATEKDNVVVGPGDDAAIVRVPSSYDLVVTTDVLLEGVHFPHETRADLIGYRAIAVNLSDLAAMGAIAKNVTIALTVEDPTKRWLSNFAFGVRQCCERFDVTVVGGNLAQGQLCVAVTALGFVERGKRLLRSGAEIGDDVWVSGVLGACALAVEKIGTEQAAMPRGRLRSLLARRDLDDMCRLFLPEPRLNLGRRLMNVATAATDISDGLMKDLRSMLRDSSCGMELITENLPCWQDAEFIHVIGDDDCYELLFTAPPSKRDEISQIAVETETRLSRIGITRKGDSIVATKNDAPVFTVSGHRSL